MVVRLFCSGDICAQNPKSAANNQRDLLRPEWSGLTQFYRAVHAEQDIVGLDVAMNDASTVQEFERL